MPHLRVDQWRKAGRQRAGGILKHRFTCGSGYPKQATNSAMHSATDLDFLFTSVQGQVWDAEHENNPFLIFKVIFKVKFKVEGRGTEYHPEMMSACVPKWSTFLGRLHDD